MKKILFLSVFFAVIFCFSSVVQAANNQQAITLKSGWNIVSTPKILSSHEFSVAENSTNLDVYIMNPSSPSGWQTMQGMGQIEFQPLYAYFINNKTGLDQTLTFNYNLDLNPSERLFSRTLNHGWNIIGIASPSYALSQYQASADTNNPSNILNSIIGSIDSIIDFTYGNSPYYSPQVSTTWVLKNPTDVNTLNDFRELKGYGVYVSGQTAAYNGYQNIDEIEQPNGTLTVLADNSELPAIAANNTSNILIGKWTFEAASEAVRVEKLTAGFSYSNISNNGNINATLRNGKIMINGSQAGSTMSLAESGTEYTINYTFQPDIETTVELYADIYDNDGAGAIGPEDTITAKLIRGNDNGVKQLSSGLIDVPLSDKASSAIQINSASATLIVKSNYGAQATVLPQTAFKIGSWTLTAGTAEDINVNGLSFAIAPVSGTTFDVTDMNDMYVTYQVGSGATVTTSVTPTPTSPVAFSVSFTLPKVQTATINLYSSLNGTVTSGHSIQATLTVTGSGAQSGANAAINNQTGQIITNVTGSLTISKSASTPVSTLVAGNNTIKTVSYKFEALNDAYTISQLTFGLNGLNGVSAVSSVNLKDGSTILSSAPAAESVTFNLATPITIAANTYKTLDVETVLGTIGSGNGTSSADIVTGFADALARPSSSGLNSHTGNTGVSTGSHIYVYKAIPTITLSTLPSGNLASGTNTISRFTIGSDTGTIAWKKIAFVVSKSDASGGDLGAITDVTLWNGSTRIVGVASVNNLDSGSTSGTVIFVPDTEEQVAGSNTYTLKANVGGTIATGDSINTRIDSGSTVFAASATFSLVNENASFIWSDLSQPSHSIGTSDWATDYLVKNLPTDTQSLTK